MNDIYLSLEPIYEHFTKLMFNDTYAKHRTRKFIHKYMKHATGCYCFAVGKITINTKTITKYHINPCEPLDHEAMHHILHKYFDMRVSRGWDNICDRIIDYIWMDLYDK